MFKKLLITFSFLIFITTNTARAEMDPRVKALGTMALYGTVGGTLLGTAALAFDAPGRSVAVGASLGLYAGLIFGGYVVGTHAMKKRNILNRHKEDNYYPDTQDSPYEEPRPEDDSSYYDDGVGGPNAKLIEPVRPKQKVKTSPVYYVQLLHLSF